MELPHTEAFGSYVNLSVNDGPVVEIAGSQPRWSASPAAWGDLARLALGDVKLEAGPNTLTFTVDRRTVSTEVPSYRFLLDELTLTATDLALQRVHLGDPGEGVTAGSDHPLVFQGTVAGEDVPPSISRIQRQG